MDPSHYNIIHNELDIDEKCIKQFEDSGLLEILFELAVNLQQAKKLSSSLKQFKQKYRLCSRKESKEAMRGFLQALRLNSNASLFQNPTPHECNEIIAIMNEFKKRTSFLEFAGQFAILNCPSPTNISEVLPYLKFAMLEFKSLNWIIPDDLIGIYLEDKFIEYSKLVPNFEAAWISRDLSHKECEQAVQALATDRRISFKSIPEAVCHICKHGDLDGEKYLSNANLVISKGICAFSNVTQDGNGRRFVFEYENDGIQHNAIVMAINGHVFLATCYPSLPNVKK